MIRAHVAAVLLLAGSFALSACKPDAGREPPPDAGDESWVRRAVPLMWGRNPGSIREVELLVQMVEQGGRAETIRAMAQRQDYVDRWMESVRDMLYVNRTGDRGNGACFGAARLDAVGPELAAFVRDNAPATSDFGQGWSMQDLLRSSLELDDLSPLLRAHLFAQLAKDIPLQGIDAALIVEENLFRIFEQTYLGRQMACLECHNAEYAVTDHEDPEVDRSWPLPGFVEKAVFGAHDGRDPLDMYTLFRKHGVLSGYDINNQQYGFPDTGCFGSNEAGCGGCACESYVCERRPQCCTEGWDPTCVSLCYQADVGCHPGTPEGWNGCTSLYGFPGCAGCGCESFVCGLFPDCCTVSWSEQCAQRCRLFDDSCEVFDWDDYYYGGTKLWGMHESCGTYLPPDEAWPDPVAIPSYFIDDLGMDATMYQVEAPLRTGFEKLRTGYAVGVRDEEDGDAAFAWLVATRIADAVWTEVMGAPLTVPNHIPRNQSQRDILLRLTSAFAEHGASLVELLVVITAEPSFNPKAPADLEEGLNPYGFEAIFNPWVKDYDIEEQRGNSVGDVLHKKPARVLVRSVTRAMAFVDWPSFPADTDVGSEGKLQEQLGFFLKDSIHGFRANDFQGQVAWENAFGTCTAEHERDDGCGARVGPGCDGCACEEDVCRALPACCDVRWDQRCAHFCTEAPDGCLPSPDAAPPAPFFVEELIEEAMRLDDAGGDITVGHAVAALKDRLLNDPDLSDPDEIAALEDAVGIPFVTRVSAASGLEEALPWACAVFISTPQFQMEGVAMPDRRGQSTEIVVPGTAFRDFCEDFAGELGGGVLSCQDSSATFRP